MRQAVGRVHLPVDGIELEEARAFRRLAVTQELELIAHASSIPGKVVDGIPVRLAAAENESVATCVAEKHVDPAPAVEHVSAAIPEQAVRQVVAGRGDAVAEL